MTVGISKNNDLFYFCIFVFLYVFSNETNKYKITKMQKYKNDDGGMSFISLSSSNLHLCLSLLRRGCGEGIVNSRISF